MKKPGLFLILNLLGAVAFAQSTPSGDAAVAIDEQKTEVTVQLDGTYVVTIESTKSALNDQGRYQLSLAKFESHQASEKVEVLSAQILHPDGTTVTIPATTFRSASIPPEKNGVGARRELTVAFDGLRIGSKTKTLVRRTVSVPPLPGYFQSDFIFGLGVLERNSRVTINSRRPLAYQSRDPDGHLQISSIQRGPWSQISITQKRVIEAQSDPEAAGKKWSPAALRKIPQVLVATKHSWDSLRSEIEKAYQKRSIEPLPGPVAQMLSRIPKTAPVSQKMALIREWMAENLKDSGRRLNTSSDWVPRPLAEIFSKKSGDGKDLAFFYQRLLRELGVPSDLTFIQTKSTSATEDLFSSTLDTEDPLPALRYFDHAVVRVKNGGSPAFLDPALGLAQAQFTDFHLHLTRGWVLEKETRGLTRIEGESSLLSEITTTFSTNGEVTTAQSTLWLRGPLAEYVTSVQYGAESGKLSRYLASIAGFPLAENIKLTHASPRDRKATEYRANLQFAAGKALFSRDGQQIFMQVMAIPSVTAEVAKLPRLAQGAVFPFTARHITRFPKLYVPSEVLHDCLQMGPMVHYDRRVQNTDVGIVITENVNQKADIEGLIEDDEQTVRDLAFENKRTRECAAGGAIPMFAQNSKDPKQVRFDEKIDPDANKLWNYNRYVHGEQMMIYRRWDELIKKNPQIADYWLRRGNILLVMGSTGRDQAQSAYVTAARESLQKAVDLNPKSILALARLGEAELLDDYYNGAVVALTKAMVLNPNAYEVAFLGGKLGLKIKDGQKALGYFQLAEKAATQDNDRIEAIQGQVSALCLKKETCDRSGPLLQKILAVNDKDPVILHEVASQYRAIGNCEKSIELDRLASAQQKFGLTTDSLVECFDSEIARIYQNPKRTQAEIENAEIYAREAAGIDSESPRTHSILFYVKLMKAKTNNDADLWKQAEQHLQKITESRDVSSTSREEHLKAWQNAKPRFEPQRAIASDPSLAQPADRTKTEAQIQK